MEDASEGIAAGGAHIVDDVGDDNVGYDEENEEVDELHGSDSVGSDSGSDSVGSISFSNLSISFSVFVTFNFNFSKKRRNNSGLQRGQEFQAAASGASQQQHEAIPYSQQGSTIFDIDASRLLG